MAIDITTILNIGGQIGKWAVILIAGIGVIGLVYLTVSLYNRKKRYDHVVRTFEKDSNGQIIQLPDDKGGIFIDKKTQYRLFLLKKSKFGLDPDQIPYLLNYKGLKIVYLLKTGLKNYQYLRPQVSSNPGLVFNVQDEDVAWAMNAWERYKNPYKNRFMEQIVPFIGMAFVFMLIVISLYFIFKHMGVLTETANAFKDAASEFARAKSGTVVVG